MTPQERALVQELFDRLAALEGEPRDRDAERAIDEGLRLAPNAIYSLVQTTLVQDEALKAADARIQELEAALDQPPPGQERGFLDNMRDSLLGRRDEPRGSVPSVPAQGPERASSPWVPMQGGAMRQTGPAQWGPAPGGPMPGGPMPQEPSRGGSFLGTAAASAAGVVGGALLLNSIRSAFGSHSQGPFTGALDPSGGRESTPWSGGSGGELSRQAGLEDIGRSGRSAPGGDGEGGRAAGAFDAQNASQDASAEDDAQYEDEDYVDDSEDMPDDGYDGGDDTSEA